MPAGDVLLPIYRGLRGMLVGSAPLTALLGRAGAVYTDGAVPQGAAFPYVTIGAGTQTPWHTMGAADMKRYGWNCTVQLKVTGIQDGEDQGLAILGAIGLELYDGRTLIPPGYGSGWVEEWTEYPVLVSTVAGRVAREWPAIVRVFVHDDGA